MIKKFKLLFSLQQINKIFPRLYPKISKSSQYGKALCESNKIKKFYGGASLKYLKKLFQKKQYFPFQKQETFFRFLESRLDIVLYRSGFFETINTAKQQIRLGLIQVNKKTVVSPKYILQPGDIIEVVSSDQNFLPVSQFFHKKKRSNTILSRLKKKKTVWRFQRSPFLLSLLNNTSTIGRDFLDNTLSNSFNINKLKHISLTEKQKQSLMEFYQSKTFERQKKLLKSLKQNTSRIISKTFIKDHKSDIFFSQKMPILNGNKNVKTKFRNNWLFSIYNLFLKKKTILSQNNGLKQKNVGYSLQILNLQRKFSLPEETEAFTTTKSFLATPPLVKKNLPLVSPSGLLSEQPLASLREPKGLSKVSPSGIPKMSEAMLSSNTNHTKVSFNFFKNQPFFVSKKIKPLHLEVSYKSRCIIFLFPPQRICLPNYINLLHIYK